MKNKAATYLLGIVVVIVWGLIIYRVVDAYSGSEEPVIAASTPMTKEPLNDYSQLKDTTHLLLNYRDPFGAEKTTSPPPRDTIRERPVKQVIAQATQQAASVKLIKPVQPAVNWSSINYTGYIRNPSSKRLLAVVQINGRELMMSEGETQEQLRLVKNLRDSIKVSYQGQTKYLTLHTASL